MTRDELLKICLDQWNNSFNGLLANITMGMGKTRMGLEILKISKNPALIITHTVKSRDETWPDEMKAWNIYPENTNLVQFDSISKEGFHYHTIVLDECHLMTKAVFEYLTENLKVNPNCRYLFLSGTMPDNDDKMKWIKSFRLPKVEYDFMTALRDGNANNIRFNIMYVEPEDTQKKYKVQFHSGLHTEKEAYFLLCKNIMIAKNEELRKMAINARMWFIYKSETKLRVLRYLHKGLLLKNKRHLLFLTTKELADEFAPFVYHSGTTTEYHDRFCAGELPYLASIEQLKTGANILNLRNAIALQINSRKHSFDQLAGRLTRIGDNKEDSVIYIIVLKDTMDQSWLAKASQNIQRKYFKTYNITHQHLLDHGV
jgi:superfamily II DNA or RNA helicase